MGQKQVASVLGIQAARANTAPRPFLKLKPQHIAVQVPHLNAIRITAVPGSAVSVSAAVAGAAVAAAAFIGRCTFWPAFGVLSMWFGGLS